MKYPPAPPYPPNEKHIHYIDVCDGDKLKDILQKIESLDDWSFKYDEGSLYLIKEEPNINYEQEMILYKKKLEKYQKSHKRYLKENNANFILKTLGLSEEKIKNMSKKEKEILLKKLESQLS